MKKRIANKWIKALRSGEYKQAVGDIVYEDKSGECSFCCLGVLTNLYVEENGMKGFTPDEKENWKLFNGENNNHESFLNEKVREWAGLETDCGYFEDDSLANINDRGASFEHIANVIEKKWKVL